MTASIHRTLILGDFHYGESYRRSGARILRDFGYQHSTVHLREFVAHCDAFVLNLETPLVSPDIHPSPYVGEKRFIHWANPSLATNALKELGVTAVSLANNHSIDHGKSGLISTLEALQDSDISVFGAGTSLETARLPFRLALPDQVGNGELHFHGFFEYAKTYDTKFQAYAKEEDPGCAPLTLAPSSPQSRPERASNAFQVAFPHWGPNYRWRSLAQRRLAGDLLDRNFDVIVGHGSHSIQEVLRRQKRWIVYSLGNGNFQSAGRFKDQRRKAGVLPYGFWAVLEVVQLAGNERLVRLKLYPVYADNLLTNYQPRPVDSMDFDLLVAELAGRSQPEWQFDNEAMSLGADALGLYIQLDLGEWPVGAAPSRLKPISTR